jgi:hypothetical protein
MNSSCATDAIGAGMSRTHLTDAIEWHVPLPAPRQPIDAWIDLMEVVEALCPTWPERGLSCGVDYRL